MIFLFGMPRSGTTWMAKIFDSHPSTLYRHEPDSVLATGDFPYIVPLEDVDSYIPSAQRYLETLLGVREIKAAGSLPQFPKAYYSVPQRRLREFLIVCAKAVDKGGSAARRLPLRKIPDLLEVSRFNRDRIVIKSVVAMGRANLFRKAAPDSKFVLILRHPCGQIASTLRGKQGGKLGVVKVYTESLAESDVAKRFDLTLERLDAMDLIEQLAWNWVIFNDKAVAENKHQPNTTIVRHEDLSLRPFDVASQLFQYTGLEWAPQSEAFIKESSNHGGAPGYFSVKRNSRSEVDKWKNELEKSDIRRIMSIVERSEAGRFYI